MGISHDEATSGSRPKTKLGKERSVVSCGPRENNLGWRGTYGAYDIPSVHGVPYVHKFVTSVPDCARTGNSVRVPLCFSLQALLAPGVIYFTSLVRCRSLEDSLMSARRPGMMLDKKKSLRRPILKENWKDRHPIRFQTALAWKYVLRI